MTDEKPIYSKRRVSTENSEFNQQAFVIQQFINKINTCTLVEVVTVNDAGLNIGMLSVRPLVTQIGSDGIPTENVAIFNVPYLRIQGGANALICDPAPGDIGFCVFGQTDLSGVKRAKKKATPGSKRRFSLADALYVGTCLSASEPTRYLRISDEGVKIKASEDVKVDAPAVDTPQALKINGTQVVGPQKPVIPLPTGGGIVDVEARAAVILLIQTLQQHGLTL